MYWGEIIDQTTNLFFFGREEAKQRRKKGKRKNPNEKDPGNKTINLTQFFLAFEKILKR